MRQLVAWTAGVIAAAVPLGASAQERPWNGWGWHPMWGLWGVGGIGMMLLFMLLFWALVIAGLVLGLRWLAAQGRASRPEADAALEILRQRYARGEINKDEFEAKRRDLAKP
jgi:putative membrane protein